MQTTRAQSMRNAIAVMTAWSAQPDGPPDLLIDCLRQHLDSSHPSMPSRRPPNSSWA